MIVIINSAKTQHYTPPADLPPGLPCSQPIFLEAAEKLADHCRAYTRQEIKTVMKISDKLVDSTIQRFQDFTGPHLRGSASPALATFAGDVFSQIPWKNYSTDDFRFADRHLRILSGLYGMLRPLDLMMPYRLEMGYKIAPGENSSLYAYWAEALTRQLSMDLRTTGSTVLLNLASKEYSQTVLPGELTGTIVTVTFKQRKDGKIKNIAVYSKRARGMFVDWFIEQRVEQLDQVRTFDRSGYQYMDEMSSETELVFLTEL